MSDAPAASQGVPAPEPPAQAFAPGLFRLDGRVALVTGSSQGIGHRLARALALSGARVVLNGRDAARLDAALTALAAEGIEARAASFDVTDSAACDRALAEIEDRHGPLEILVNNAGIQRRTPLHEASDAVWREVLATNLDAAFYMGRAAALRMMPRGRGAIVNVCSLMSELGRATTGPYAAAKGGLRMLTRAMCADWAGHGLRVNAIAPGYMTTEMIRPLREDPEFDAWLRRRTPAGRWGHPDELAGAVVFLASDASAFVNGQMLAIDGGITAAI